MLRNSNLLHIGSKSYDMKYSIVTVIETQERHEKSPKKRQLLKPDAAPLGDSSYIVSSFPSVKDPIP